jgi:hypothetical protein
MTIVVAILGVALAITLAVALVRERDRGRRRKLTTASPKRILFPFTGTALSQRGLDAALRLARVDGATLVPAFLARVPMHLPLDAALPRQCEGALPLLEAVEQRAIRAEVPVDSRIERGRTVRHALTELIAHERFGRLVVPAGPEGSGDGLEPADVAWLIDHAPSEVAVLRPGLDGARDLSPTSAAARSRARRRRRRARHARV